MVPITIISGSLGAGKTTIILNLIKQLPKDYKSVWLKNEYGDIDVDTKLINQNNIKTKEILNGCLCCVLVGKIHDAIEEIQKNYKPERIIIETAGTAYPFPIIDEIGKVSGVFIDGFINIIDVLNFEKLADKSALAKAQADYFDLIIFNKHELAKPEQMDRVEGEVFEIYPKIPKIKSQNGFVDKDLILGLDRHTISINPSDNLANSKGHIHEEIETFSIQLIKPIRKDLLEKIITGLNSADFFRIKGIVKLSEGDFLLNYVLGRFSLEQITNQSNLNTLVFMGSPGISNLRENIEAKLKY